MPEQIVIVEYDPHWPELFEKLRTPVAKFLGNLALVIEHVGSTSVPGLPAKPIVDTDVVVESTDHFRAATLGLATLGYVHEGNLGISGAKPNSCHLPPHATTVCLRNSKKLHRHLSFRDYLIKHYGRCIQICTTEARTGAEVHQ